LSRPRAFPASAAGPKLREMLVGSEGVLGVITESTLQVKPAPTELRYEGWMFRSFEEGSQALRAPGPGGGVPDGPGGPETPLTAKRDTPAVRAAYERGTSLGGIADPSAIGDAAVFLASDASRYVTGHELLVDGGLTINGSVGHARA